MRSKILIGIALASVVLASSMPFASAASEDYFAVIGGTDVVDIEGVNPELEQDEGQASITSVVPLLNGKLRVTVFCHEDSQEDCMGRVTTTSV